MSGPADNGHSAAPEPLDRTIRRLIAVFGADAVKAEIAKLTKPRRGAPPKKDGLLLRPFLEPDAKDWLEGRNPFELRTNNANAKAADGANPASHTQPLTQWRRLMRWQGRWRMQQMLWGALDLAWDQYPYAAHFRVLEALAEEGARREAKGELPKEAHGVWQLTLQLDRKSLARYRELYGEPPSAMTWREIEAKPLWDPLAALLPKPQSLFDTFPAAAGKE
jgi:hypothetical protein